MSKFSLPKTDYQISEESALAQVMQFVTYYAIDIDGISDAETRAAVEMAGNKLVEFCRMGLLEITLENGDLKIKQNLKRPPGEVAQITYGVIRGDAKLATDGFAANDRYKRSYAMMERLSDSISGTIKQLQGVDLAVVENLGLFFLLGSS